MVEPFELTAVEAVAEIAAGRLSGVDLVESLLARIELLDSAVHAWVRVDADRARSVAKNGAARLALRAAGGKLLGIPVGLKDIYFTAGLATEAGSPIHRGFIPTEDARTVAHLKKAGAIVLGKTETTQFAMGDPAPTRNPWSLDHTPGGSSSGSAAAVAARMVTVALGTQTAGSVLRPAAFCGVVGFKPSRGRFSLAGIFPLAWSLDHPGTLSRSVADARLLFSILDERGERMRPGAADQAPRIGLLGGAFLKRADTEARDNLELSVRTLARAGASVMELSLPEEFDLMVDVHHVIMASEAAAYHAGNHAKNPADYRPNLRALIETGSLIPATAYLQAQRLRAELAGSMAGLFAQVDCLVMPSATGIAPPDLSTTGNPVFNAPWSLLGLPALSIPSGLSAKGLPFGLQLIGPSLADIALLDAAEWCERSLPRLSMPAAVAALA